MGLHRMSITTLPTSTVLLLFSALCVIIVAPPLRTPLGIYGDPQLWLPIVMLLALLSRIFKDILSINQLRYTITFLFLSILLAVCSSLAEGAGNVYGMMRLCKALIVFLGIACFTQLIKERYGVVAFRHYFPLITYLIISLNGCVMAAQFFSPTFFTMTREYTLAGAYTEILYDPTGEYRMPGLSLSGGAQISLFQSIAILLYPILVLTERSLIRIIIYTALLFINVFGVMISGRSGFYNLAALAPVMFILILHDRRRFDIEWRRGAIIIAACIIVISGLLYAVEDTEEIAKRISPSLASAISRNLDFLSGQTGFIRNETTEVLWYSHIRWPDNLQTWLIGSPEVMEERGLLRTLDSDIGYIVSINAFGIVNTLLQLIVNLMPCIIALRYRSHSIRLGYAAIAVSGSVLLFNAKEVMFFTRMAWPLQMIIWCAFVYSLEHSRKDWWWTHARRQHTRMFSQNVKAT